MSKYKWRSSYRARVAADVAHAEMERIRDARGALTPSAVVDEARDKNNPLHPEFTWDNKKAAEQYRLQEAREMIRAVITIETTDTPESNTFVLVTSDSDEQNTEYKRTETVVRDVDLFADALGRLSKDLEGARAAVQNLERVAQMSGAEPERMARISLATKALEAASAAVLQLH